MAVVTVPQGSVLNCDFDRPVVGYGGKTINTLRLWAAKSSREFDLDRFNAGEYVRNGERYRRDLRRLD